MTLLDETAAMYRRWAMTHAHKSSATYERLAYAVADEPRAIELLNGVEPIKRQPNLLFAALRWLEVPLNDPREALDGMLVQWPRVAEVMRVRRTQTNEPARCATLLPALAQLPGPLALVEVGASAGLCLLYDRWSYAYSGNGLQHRIESEGAQLTLACTVAGPVPLPATVPEIAWRAGLDIDPIDPADVDGRRWLECLVWPEHHDRARRLRIALDVAAEDGVRVITGDLVADLPALLDTAPLDATLVVVHSSTLAYVGEADRESFAATLARYGAHRVGAEHADVLPALSGNLPPDSHAKESVIVSRDDRALGVADRHGRAISWL